MPVAPVSKWSAVLSVVGVVLVSAASAEERVPTVAPQRPEVQILVAYYSLSGRELEREILPAVRDLGLGTMIWSPLAGGFLTITAREESVGGYDYTSARLRTLGKHDFTFGRMEMRARMPIGQGMWPAFWMLSSDTSIYGPWAASGEIDIVEYLGSQPDRIFGTIHYGGEAPGNLSSETKYTPSEDVTGGFNTYALEWDEFEIRWYFNGTLYAVQNSWFSIAEDFPAPFNQNFYVLFNLAVGGNFPGSPDGTTPSPATIGSASSPPRTCVRWSSTTRRPTWRRRCTPATSARP